MQVNDVTAKTEYKPTKALSSAFEWVSAALTAVIVVALLFSAVFRLVNVEGDSMCNTLTSGDRLLISNFAYTPDYGDIVVIRRENDTPLIKRIIGLPGDTMYINPETGIVYRNGVALEEPYVLGGFTDTKGMNAEVLVEEGALFVLGDNRSVSLDSRMLGCQSMDNLVGRVFFRLPPKTGWFTNGE